MWILTIRQDIPVLHDDEKKGWQSYFHTSSKDGQEEQPRMINMTCMSSSDLHNTGIISTRGDPQIQA